MGKLITDEEFLHFKELSLVEQTVQVAKAKAILKMNCELKPTCDGCLDCKKHIGCEFRGKSPREW
jgi:hypothetical protein